MPKDRSIKCLKKVAGEFGVSESTLRRMVERGEFPPPVQVSKGRIGWWSDELEQFKSTLRRLWNSPQLPGKGDGNKL